MFHVGHIQLLVGLQSHDSRTIYGSLESDDVGQIEIYGSIDLLPDHQRSGKTKSLWRGVYLSRSRKGMTFHETSWHGKAFRINGPLWRESIGDRCIPLIKGRYCGLGVVFLKQPSVDDISTKSENKQLQWLQTVFLTCRISCFIWRPALDHVEGKIFQVGSDKHYVGPPWDTANDLYRFRMILRRGATTTQTRVRLQWHMEFHYPTYMLHVTLEPLDERNCFLAKGSYNRGTQLA